MKKGIWFAEAQALLYQLDGFFRIAAGDARRVGTSKCLDLGITYKRRRPVYRTR